MSPFFERLLEREALDPEREAIVRSFAEKGYLVLDDLGIDDFDELADRVEADVASLHDGGRFNRIADAYAVSDAVRALAASPRVLSILQSLYGRRPIPFQTLNFWRGSEQVTHSDAIHFHSFPRHFMCGVWVALEDTDDSNGALHYYPGSHRLPDHELVDLGLPSGKQFYDGYETFVRQMIAESGLPKEKPHLKRGQAIVWAANLYHGGDAIADPTRTRKSQVTHYYFENCVYYTPLRSDIARGRVFARQIVDVATGRMEPLRFNGRRVRAPFLSHAVSWDRRVRRALGRGYQQHGA
jgi:hypothetical protein